MTFPTTVFQVAEVDGEGNFGGTRHKVVEKCYGGGRWQSATEESYERGLRQRVISLSHDSGRRRETAEVDSRMRREIPTA